MFNLKVLRNNAMLMYFNGLAFEISMTLVEIENGISPLYFWLPSDTPFLFPHKTRYLEVKMVNK